MKELVTFKASEMEKGKLFNAISERDNNNFIIYWNKIKSRLEKTQIQELLVEIIDFQCSASELPFFTKIFILILKKKVNMNFNIEHWAPSLLALIVLRCPSI